MKKERGDLVTTWTRCGLGQDSKTEEPLICVYKAGDPYPALMFWPRVVAERLLEGTKSANAQIFLDNVDLVSEALRRQISWAQEKGKCEIANRGAVVQSEFLKKFQLQPG